MVLSRRFLLGAALFGVASAVALPAVPLRTKRVDGELNPGLLRRALGALEQHREQIVSDSLFASQRFHVDVTGSFAVTQRTKFS